MSQKSDDQTICVGGHFSASYNFIFELFKASDFIGIYSFDYIYIYKFINVKIRIDINQ